MSYDEMRKAEFERRVAGWLIGINLRISNFVDSKLEAAKAISSGNGALDAQDLHDADGALEHEIGVATRWIERLTAAGDTLQQCAKAMLDFFDIDAPMSALEAASVLEDRRRRLRDAVKNWEVAR